MSRPTTQEIRANYDEQASGYCGTCGNSLPECRCKKGPSAMPRDSAASTYHPEGFDDRTKEEQNEVSRFGLRGQLVEALAEYVNSPTITAMCKVNNLLSDYQSAWIKAKGAA